MEGPLYASRVEVYLLLVLGYGNGLLAPRKGRFRHKVSQNKGQRIRTGVTEMATGPPSRIFGAQLNIVFRIFEARVPEQLA
jgi:hypothetical protein